MVVDWVLFILSIVAMSVISILIYIGSSFLLEKLETKRMSVVFKCEYNMDINCYHDQNEVVSAVFDYYNPEQFKNRLANFIGTITNIISWGITLLWCAIICVWLFEGEWDHYLPTSELWLLYGASTAARLILTVASLTFSLLLTNRLPGVPAKVLSKMQKLNLSS